MVELFSTLFTNKVSHYSFDVNSIEINNKFSFGEFRAYEKER